MKLRTITISLLILLILTPMQVFAQEEEKKTTDPLQQQLNLDIPKITDNPSLIINFNDPSKEKQGVQLSVDKKGFETITSPHTLPALSIGDHLLTFKFTDEYDVTQSIDKELIVIPRAPVLNTPLIQQNEITFSGTALAGSEVTIIINSNQKMVTKLVEVDNDGVWNVKLDENLPSGLYTFSGLTKKYGYASDLAEPITLDIDSKGSKEVITTTTTPIHFAFKDMDSDNIQTLTNTNIDLLVLSVGLLSIGLLLGILFSSLSKKKKEEKVVKEVAKTLDKPIDEKEKPMTLLEKLKEKTVNIENPIPEKNSKEEKTKEEKPEEPKEKIVTKVDFLKGFKEHDPDDDKGKEKKDLKISLTSKK
ncbi:MAG: hypothetical protein ACOX0R_02355 [Candidatus Dojkabacteria bacterium]|jgi:hypothetical protein